MGRVAVLALPTLLLSIDIFVLLLALPKIDGDLRATSTQQLWISAGPWSRWAQARW